MLSIITSYLLQAGKGALPHIGIFSTIYKPAERIANGEILPPHEEFVFKEEEVLSSPGLVSYIASKKNITESGAASALDRFCREWREKINGGETLCFTALGCLKRSEMGIALVKADGAFFSKISPALKLPGQDTRYNFSEDDATVQETAVEQYSEMPAPVKRSWQVWAAVFFAFTILLLFYSFYNNKLSTKTIGNRSTFTIKTAGYTHLEPSR